MARKKKRLKNRTDKSFVTHVIAAQMHGKNNKIRSLETFLNEYSKSHIRNLKSVLAQ